MSSYNPMTTIYPGGRVVIDENMYFLDKDRIFDPTTNPRYANNLGLPSLLLKENPIRGITHLHIGPDFAGQHNHNGLNCADQDTIVMEVGAREMRGMTTGARWFGEGSRFNRQSLASNKSRESMDAQILSMTCAGMNSLREVFESSQTSRSYPAITTAIIITSSDMLVDGVKNLFSWTKNGFPDAMPEGTIKMCFGLLRNHIQNADAKGLEVKFWKVAPHYIHHATFQAECALLDHFNVPPTDDPDTCTCGKCIVLSQYKELCFARDGHGCCEKDPRSVKLAIKYGNLKQGDMIPLTNNADVDVTIPMRVDAKGFVFGFCPDGSVNHF